jgi:hypothetical protein
LHSDQRDAGVERSRLSRCWQCPRDGPRESPNNGHASRSQ